MTVYIGCPMWGYKEWVGNFFPAHTPASDFLRIYSKQLNTVEGNTVFYSLPSAETITRWAQETPPTFRFCPKLSRTISHEADLSTQKAEVLSFVERMRGFGSRLGPIFLQLPPSFGPAHLSELQTFLDFWPNGFRLAIEVRHADFYKDPHTVALNTLLEKYSMARVMMDTRPICIGSAAEQELLQTRERKPILPLQVVATTDFTFVRYIGNPHMEVNAPLLDSWAQQIAQWVKRGITPYIFCHCPFEEHSPTICSTLYEGVRALIPLPALPWSSVHKDERPEQMRLF